MKLREYQEEAIADLDARFAAGAVRVPQVLATGLGKTVIFATYIDRWLARNAGRRALVIVHTDELVSQAVEKLRAVAPGRRIGIVKAAQNETLAEVIVASRQTLAGQGRRAQLRHVGLIIVDEAHHAVRTNTYGTILEHFGAFDANPPVRVAGFTATLVRSDKSRLSGVWESCTFTRDILFGIRHGYLLDVRGERIIVPDLDLSNVRTRGGDYSEADLGEELERTFAPEVIAGQYAIHATDRKGIAFWPLVDTAYSGAEAFNAAGIPSDVIHGQLPKLERRLVLKRFREGDIQVLHNAMVLTEGFDEPSADVVVIARPTRAAGLYQQMVGRVLRPDLMIAPEQRQKALILDVTGAGAQHDLRSLIDLAPERKLKQDSEGVLSLLELDVLEFQQEIDDELDDKRAGATYSFESDEYRGEAATKTFDPLGREKVWGKTPAGTYYISTGNAYVFIVESLEGDPGTYDVVLCSPANYVRDGVVPWAKGTEHRALHLDMALSWGEELAVQVGGVGTKTLTSRASKWRGGAPSEAQRTYATRLGIEVDGMTKGQLSEAIDNISAARRIDPLVKKVTGV